MKNVTTMIVLLSLFFSMISGTAAVYADEPASEQQITAAPNLVAEAGILIDAKTGTVLYNKNMDVQKEPASTTKMITAILAIEQLSMDRVVTIDSETPFTEGSKIYLLEDEEITVEQLLYALLLESANDAAVALGKEMAGSVEAFAVMMNEKAKELGAKNTNFVNPNGLHEEGHLTTAYDLAMIAKAAMENPEFRKFVNTYQYTIPATNKQETRYMYNTNRLLYDEKTKVSANGVIRTAKYEGVTGIKTGYTSHAGGCLVSGAIRGDTELIAVVLKSTDTGRFGDSIALLDWGFENYHTVKTVDAGEAMGTIKIKGGAEKEAALKTESDGYATVQNHISAENLTKVIKTDENIEAPGKEGQIVGTVDFFHGDALLSSVNVVLAEEVPEGGILAALGVTNKTAKKIYITTGVFTVVAVAAISGLLVIRRNNIRKRQKRRAERAMRIAMDREMDKLYYNRDKYMNR